MSGSLDLTQSQRVSFGPFIFDGRSRQLSRDGLVIDLRPREIDLLALLAEKRGEPVTKDELIQAVWGGAPISDAHFQVQMSGLVRALGGDGDGWPRYIVSTPGAFRLNPDTTAEQPSVTPPVFPLPNNLPRRTKSVLGRGRDLRALMDHAPEHRLLNISGPAGMGKSTLAVLAAESLLHRFIDGVYLVDLSTLADPKLVVTSIAASLGLTLTAATPAEDLIAFLTPRHALLVLDNCDHVIDATADLAQAILAQTPSVHILSTCREPLGLCDEWFLKLESLELAPVRAGMTARETLAYSATQLFASRTSVPFDDGEAPLLAELCHKLDGNPFALELAAARIGLFDIATLAAVLDDCFTRFTEEGQTIVSSTQIARATVDWTYELLSDPAQCILRRLSALRGEFTLSHALSVCGTDDSETDLGAVIGELVSVGLIETDVGTTPVRHRLPFLVRNHTFQKLIDSGELHPTARRHADMCVELLRDAGATTLPVSIDDIRAALTWSFSPKGDLLTGIRLTTLSVETGKRLSLLGEYSQQLDRALERIDELQVVEPRLGLRLLIERMCINQHTNDDDHLMAQLKVKSFELAQHIYDVTGDPADLLAIHQTACSLSYSAGNGPETRYYADCMAEVAQRSGIESAIRITAPRMQAQAFHFLGEHDRALPIMHDIIAMPDDVIRSRVFVPGDRIDPRISLAILHARTLWMLGQPEQASAAASELVEKVRDSWDHALCYVLSFTVLPIAIWRGDLTRAGLHLGELTARASDRRLEYWGRWGDTYTRAMAFLQGGQSSHAEPLRPFTDNNMQIDLIATLHEGLVFETAVTRVETGLVGWCAPEVLRAHTERQLALGQISQRRAEQAFLRAYEIADRQQALGWQLRSAMSLARFWRYQDKAAEGARLLDQTLSRFREGFGDDDLVAARALLRDLSPA